ncbi:uncharacterized protein LOC122621647 isoform X4 [Drosophila teissieri]|uniref:uncharacterized protein LOC122621647 isoform X4 n=1 Tax=Drosophila teissieri TaxID=7243 RepID=UPI001CBA4711|nr:uncharacterized protein LOC122621647 isoform X4 [Drosophila teissieri]
MKKATKKTAVCATETAPSPAKITSIRRQTANGKQDERSRRQDMSRSRTQQHMCVDSVTVAGNCHFSVVLLL